MDLSFLNDAVVMVRNCGCGRHGFISTWYAHEDDWKDANQADALRILNEHRARFPQHKDKHDAAERTIHHRHRNDDVQ